MHESRETESIRQRMEVLRCDLDEDVQEIVEGAREVRDWRSYVRSYPWVCVGAALAIGYWIVPGRHFGLQDAPALAELAKQSRLLAESHSGPKRNVRGMLLTIAGNLLARGALSIVERCAGKYFGSPTVESPQDAQP